MRAAISLNKITSCLEDAGIDFSCDSSGDVCVYGFCSLNYPKESCITWVKEPARRSWEVLKTVGEAVIVTPEPIDELHSGIVQLVTGNPKRAFFTILEKCFPSPQDALGVHPSAVVLSEVQSEGVSIGAGCYVGEGVSIGRGTRIMPNVTIVCPCTIGENCIIWPGTVIGADGFGFWKDEMGRSHKVPHYGGVRIGNDVEIGANCCIDRGTLDDTVIMDGVKIDDLVLIAHNTIVGKDANIVGMASTGGSDVLGERAYVAPGARLMNQIKVGEDAFVGIGSVVLTDVRKGKRVLGNPARAIRM